MKKTITLFLSILLLFSMLLVGCGNKDGGTSPSASQTPTGNTSSDTFTLDNYGRKVTVSGVPKKVATLGPNCSELFVALGLEDYIIGNTLDNHSRGPLPEYAEAYEKIPELNYGSATREAIISSGADFIYGIDWEFGEAGLDIAELEKMGITVYMNSATTLDEIYQEIMDLGKIFQIEDRAQAFVDDQKNRISTIGNAIKGEDPVKVLVYDSGNDGVFTCSGINFENYLIELAGGENIFADLTEKQWVTVSYEEVLKREPDVIIIHDYDAPSVEEKIAEIKSNPSLSKLKCVQKERFLSIALESVLPGGRMAYTVETFHEGFMK
ncbi:MAG: ABC transporter substrate-binding protein [Christensenellaceae bacterium]|jgi:iron complex transport system substrate-binding protein